MANPIRRLVQLVLDRASAKRTETEAKAALGGIDKSADVLGATFKKLGGLIAAAFSIAALKRFGAAAIGEAKAADLAWSKLRNTLGNMGEDVEARTAEIEGLAKAWQAATTFGDDDFAVSLDRLIGLTDDYGSSVNNMGLVANVAARFFDGDLAPATDLVGKAMMGQTRQLKQLGIEAETAQGALDELAERSMGAAEARANTYAGKIEQLRQNWLNFLEALGMIVVGSDSAKSGLGGLSTFIQRMTAWVEANADTLRSWAVDGFGVVISAIDGTVRALFGMAKILSGVWSLSLIPATGLLMLFLEGQRLIAWTAAKVSTALGADGLAKTFEDLGDKILQANVRLGDLTRDMANAGKDLIREGVGAFTTPLFRLPAGGLAEPLNVNAPRMSPNATGEDDDADKKDAKREAAERKRLAFLAEAAQITDKVRTATEIYDATIALLGKHLAAGTITQETYNRAFQEAREVLLKANEATNPISDTLADHAQRMAESARLASVLGSEYSALEAEAAALNQAIAELAEVGGPNADAAMAGLADRLKDVQAEMRLAAQEAAFMGEIAGQAASFVSAAFSQGIGPAAAAKAKMNALEAVEQGIRGFVSSLNPFTAWQAPGHYAAAAMHAKLAAAWGSLAGATGGFSGGGASGGGGSAGPSRTGDVGGRRSEGMTAMGADVSIYLVGPGWDAMNPEVQRVVMGAQQQAQERYGENARVRVQRSG